MRVALKQVDGKWPNLALMKLAAWHRVQGDTVDWFSPLWPADRVYASKIFGDTPDDPYLPTDTVRGGTGYDFISDLPPEVEAIRPDYSLYPDYNYAIGFTTRGCIRHCRFCLVPKKEGELRVVGDLYSIWSGQRMVRLLDNNLTAAPMDHFGLIMEQAQKERVTLDITQGLDLRLLQMDHLWAMRRVRFVRRFHFAWDNPAEQEAIRRGLVRFGKFYHPTRATVYVLVGFNTTPEEDMHRIEVLRGLQADPFVMPYGKTDPYQRRLARWCNRKHLFKAVEWKDYNRRVSNA